MSVLDHGQATVITAAAQEKMKFYVNAVKFREDDCNNAVEVWGTVPQDGPGQVNAFFFRLVLPLGLPGYVISNALFVKEELRGIITPEVDKLKERMAILLGAKHMLASVRADNPPELARLFKHGWKNLSHIGNLNGTAHLLFESPQLG